MTPGQLSTGHKNRELHPNTDEKGERDCTRLKDNKKCVHYAGPQNSPSNQIHHERPSLPEPPPEPHELTSSHASSEVSSSGVSTSYGELSSCLTGDTVDASMVLSSSQKEMKESLSEQNSRGGGLSGPIETEEWRSLKELGMGDCLKLPKMAHWQAEEEEECCKGDKCSLMR